MGNRPARRFAHFLTCRRGVSVGLIREEGDIGPHGGTRLQIGDELLIAIGNDGIDQFRTLIAPPGRCDRLASYEMAQ